METTEHLPMSVDEITPQWLTTALRSGRNGLDVVVDHLEVTEIVWGTATKVLLKVSYGADHNPGRLCVKGGFVPELRALMAAGYQAEARFYRDIAPVLDAGLPRCYFAADDADVGQGIVILDDLVAGGAKFCDAREPLSVDQVADALEVLAGWHSRSDINDPWLDSIPHFRPMVQGLLTPDHWDDYADRSDNPAVLEVLADRERVTRGFNALWASEDARPRVLIHGDANLTNVYLDDAGSPRFVDWQFVCRGDAYHDVALFLMGALAIEDRRVHEQELLRIYLAARRETADSFDEAWAAYRRHALHGTVYALTPEEMQPAAVRAALAERFAQAAIDLETYTVLDV